MGWNNLPDMVMISDISDTSDTDRTEWLKGFHKQNHIISNSEYTWLKLSNFAVGQQQLCLTQEQHVHVFWYKCFRKLQTKLA